jgi:hypothetical protein
MRFPTDAAGSSIECPKCHNFFTAAPEDETASPERFRQLVVPKSAVAVAGTPATRTAENLPPALTDPASAPDHSGLTETASAFTSAFTAAKPRNLCGVAAFLCGGVGLLCASLASFHFLTMPLAALGLIAGIAGLLLEAQRRQGLILAALGTLVCLPVLLLAAFWPHHLSDSYGRSRTAAPPNSKTALAIRSRGDHIHEAPRPAGDDPMPSHEGGLRIGNVQVRVLRAVPGPVELRNARPDKPLPVENYLAITIRVANVGTKDKLKYQSWGAALGTRAGHAPRLTDNQGKSYGLKDFGSGVTVPGRFRSKELLPGKSVDDRLIFPEPSATADFLILELPANAVGGENAFKFKILRGQIKRDGRAIRPGL